MPLLNKPDRTESPERSEDLGGIAGLSEPKHNRTLLFKSSSPIKTY